MLIKKDFKELADMCSLIVSDEDRERIIKFLCSFCVSNNNSFEEDRFREWIRRRRANESTRGLK